MENSDTTKKIVFLDSTSSIDDIKRITDWKNIRIITFDYVSHKQLLESKIEHDISDDFLNEDELQTIQNESFNLTKWYDGELESSLLYENINLGRIFYVEFHHFFVTIFKKDLRNKKNYRKIFKC